MNEIKTKDYSMFLANEPKHGRHYLNKPIKVKKGSAFANGHIMAFIDGCNEGKEIDKIKIVESIEKMIKSAIGYSGEAIFLPDTPDELFICGKCGGKGIIAKCDECYGSGEVELESDYNDYTCVCKSCDGFGENVKCPKCEGKKHFFGSEKAIEILGVKFDPYYVKILKENLDNPRAWIDSNRMLNIAHDNGYAFLMPRNR